MHENQKMYKLLQMIALLCKSGPYTAQRLARRYQVSERTIYRHFQLLRECGFQVEKDGQHRYFIAGAAEVFQQHGRSFSLEEAQLIKEAVLALHGSHPLRQNLLAKLFAHSELNTTAELIFNKLLGKVMAAVGQGMQQQKQVLLKNYHSLNSQSVKDRLVEPIAYVNNMRYFTAYEPARKKVLQFKADRAAGAELQKSSFKYAHRHYPELPDAFGMNGKKSTTVKLKLSARAASLLREEFPLAATGLQEKSKAFTWQGKIKAWEGIGRFVLGLPGEIEIQEPAELTQYLKKQSRKAPF